MQIEQIITALHNAKVYEAAKLQCDNVDNLSMLVAVATGKVATYNELYELFRKLTALSWKETMMKTIALRNVIKGDYVKRKADSKAVYIKGDYDKTTKSFELIDVEDICRCIYVKADKPVVVGFTY